MWTTLGFETLFIGFGDVRRDDSQQRFLAQHSFAMLDNAAKLRNNVVTLCCAKNRRQESSRVTSLLGIGEILKDETESAGQKVCLLAPLSLFFASLSPSKS